MAEPVESDAPVRGRERIAELDLLRGLALLGILFMNIEFPSGWLYRGEVSLLAVVLDVLAEGKFVSLFSILFGFGFAVQMRRGTTTRYLRRTLGLFLIGLAHAVFLFSGDILVSYAVAGLFLLPFRRAATRTLLAAAGVFMAIAGVAMFALSGMTTAKEAFTAADKEAILEHVMTYANGSFLDVAAVRLAESQGSWALMPFVAPQLTALFLIGMAAARAGVLTPGSANEQLLRRGRNAGLLLGLPLAIACGVALYSATSMQAAATARMAGLLVAPVLTIGYACLAVLLYRAGTFGTLAAPFRSAGRMALTNYLGQSVICSLLFCGYGFGQFGQVGYPPLIALAVLIFAGQVAFSRWWLRHYSVGPAEWVLRSFTYGEVQPLRRSEDHPAQAAVAI